VQHTGDLVALLVVVVFGLTACRPVTTFSGSTASSADQPKPFLSIPLAKDAPTLRISEGWIYSEDEGLIHPVILTHFAVDLRAEWGTPIYAPADGLAVASYHIYDMVDAYDRVIGYGLGLFVQIWHEEAKLYSSYSHLSRISETIPYIPPTLEGDSWQPRRAIYVPINVFKGQAKPLKMGDLIGYIGYTGLRLGYKEVPANPPSVDSDRDKTWDPNGAHLHWEVFSRTPDGSKKKDRYDPFGIYGEREEYVGIFTKATGLILANPDGSPQFAR